MRTILATEGNGYIGSHTAVELIHSGYHVIIADDLSNSSQDTIERIEKITGYRPVFYYADVTEKGSLRKIFQENDIDTVMHFADYKAVGESVREPVKYYQNNPDTTRTLLEVMKEYDVKKILFSSSATVYGNEQSGSVYRNDGTGKVYQSLRLNEIHDRIDPARYGSSGFWNVGSAAPLC